MDKQKNSVISGNDDIEEFEIAEACRMYRIIQKITNNGCDAEVKKVKGELKILSVRKSVALDFTTTN